MKAPAYPWLYQVSARVWLTGLPRTVGWRSGALGDDRVHVETPRARQQAVAVILPSARLTGSLLLGF